MGSKQVSQIFFPCGCQYFPQYSVLLAEWLENKLKPWKHSGYFLTGTEAGFGSCVLLSAQFWERDLIASAQAAKEGSCCGAGGWDLVKGEIPLINFRSRQNCEYMNYQMQSVTSWGERGAQHQSQHPFPPLDVTQALFVEASAICSSSFRKIYKF